MAEEKKDEKDEGKAPEAEEAGEKPEENDEAAEETVDDVKERLVRLAADFDNYKKRVAKEIADSKTIGKAEAITKILPNVDELELAIAALGKDGDKGITLVYTNFMNTLKALGLKEIDSKGAFDPYKHEIMLAQASDEKEGTILQVVRKGYMLNGIMLRPASVIVSKGKADAADEKKENEEEKK